MPKTELVRKFKKFFLKQNEINYFFTGMAVTLEQVRILQQEFHLPTGNMQNVLDVMRSEGTRLDNTFKNICRRKYAFNLPQVLSLPALYRPPTASFGKAQS